MKAQLRPADGQAGKSTAVKEFGGTVTKFLPAVLSSHLDENARHLKQASLAGYVRAFGDSEGPQVRVVVEHTADSSLVIRR